MTRPWWDNAKDEAHLVDGRPVLMPGGRKAAIAALQARIAGFVPEWRDLSEEDAGVALVRLFGLQLDPVLQRVERLPEKALVEFLRTAGIGLAAARSAKALVSFVPEDSATGPIDVAEGTALSSARADGEQGDVTWETEDALTVQPVTLEERQVFDGEVKEIIDSDSAFDLLGPRPEVGAALYLGLAASGVVSGRLTLAFETDVPDRPAPVAAGLAPPPPRPPVQLRWEGLTATGFDPAEVVLDETDGFRRMGRIGLDLPRGMAVDRLPVLGEGDPLYWVRIRLAGGTFEAGARITGIHLNVVPVEARKTWRDEFPILELRDGHPQVQLARTPVLSGSVVLDVDEGIGGGGLFDLDAEEEPVAAEGQFRRWSEVATLSGQPADARVFTLDGASGVITFGDGREGRAPPPGIRGVAVRSYAVTLGAAGNVAAGEINRMPNRIRGISEVGNPWNATGGASDEDRDTAIAAGPAKLKARGRAVSAGDMALLAKETQGANVRHAWIVSGLDPTLANAARPGTAAVYVLPWRHPSDPGDLPPVSDSQTLATVATHIAEVVGPLGARIVAAAPRFHDIRIEALVTVTDGGDAAAAQTAVRAAVDHWLSPETGSWSVGDTIRHADLSHIILGAHPDIIAAPFLALSRGGIGFDACQDVPLAEDGLPWPGRHRIAVEMQEGGR